MTDDDPSLISRTRNDFYPHVAIVRPLEHRTITDRQYYELPPLPPLNFFNYKSPEIKKEHGATYKRIGFIGMGMMGQRLVRNLLVTGHDVSVWNRTPEKCRECVAAGAQQLLTPADVVWNSDVIFSCVSGPEAVKSCMYETWGIEHGFEKSVPGSKGYIELSSIDPDTSQEMCAAITEKGGKYLEAPIRGSRSLAEDGLLLALVAGDHGFFEEYLPCFAAMCKDVYHVSCNVGDASKMNLALSTLAGTTNAAAAEVMTMIEQLDIQLHNYSDFLRTSPMKSSFLLENFLPLVHEIF
ncbi:putative oxidoreductase GLYR1 homolog [Trichonephila inaurata madagascariensis]|uniref:Putative oxidoreductase GLYR1 homolog n=1 Tax=Trichonephila inaurata madagascariensis TaxID=2747483 RepID=A0A8X6JYD9_9ARAC|nr:putative oxidoreductase GLYR1 homolog [Trichonephila inaurata madagascariensis]